MIHDEKYRVSCWRALDIRMEKELDKLVLEYLTFRQYKKTCKIFNQESGLSSLVNESIKEEKIQEFLELLQSGNRLEFFKAWDASMHGKDENVKLEFLFHVYFAILPIHDYVICNKDTIRTSMNHFKNYLDTKGSVLCKDDEFLCYYALPYIPEESLKQHPSFKNIFTKEWVQDLHYRMISYLNNRFSESSSNFPRLIYMYQVKVILLKYIG